MNDSAEQQASGRIQDSNFFSHFMTPFPRLAQAGKRDVGQTFERLAELVGGSPLRARVHFGIVDGDTLDSDAVRSWSLELGTDHCQVRVARTPDPDLELLLKEETWWQIADGALPPLEAFGKGAMRVRGDLRVALRFVGLLNSR